MEDSRPIAVFDSGVGGLSVLVRLRELMPEEDFIYLGDRKNAPYGSKTHEEVRRIAEKNVDMLVLHGAKAVVIACNTATAAAVEPMRKKYPQIPIIGIEPAVKPAVDAGCGRILVLATPRTVSEPRFTALMERRAGNSSVIGVPCEGLSQMVESGECEGKETDEYFERLFTPFRSDGFDAVVLGCTHYPFVRSAIRRAVGEKVAIFDGAEGTARHTKSCLEYAGLRASAGRQGKVIFLATDGEEGVRTISDFYRKRCDYHE
ncbi:MAG: glutamate racemase [Clostridia bacterium]|nr:glutamate racemase [Clostridia bacterium]